jgi:hypothetical protein
MITFNNIVERFEIFAENHFFIKSFSFGSPDDVDLSKFEEFPLMHLVYTGATYDAGTKTYNLEVYILDVPHDKKGKVIPQKEAISDSEQCAEDIIADIRMGGNIFTFAQDYEVVNATTTPLEEETKNVLSGVLLDLSVAIPYEWDACNAPIDGVAPGGGEVVYARRGVLRMLTLDGTTDVQSVRTIKVTNGTLTDDGDGVVTLDTGGVETLEALTDVTITNAANGQVIKYLNGIWINAADGGAISLNDLTDVIISQPSTGEFFRYDGDEWVNDTASKSDVGLGNVDNTSDVNKPISTATQTALDAKPDNLRQLNDVTISGPATDQVLQYDGADWVNATFSAAQTLEDLTDVDIADAPANGSLLEYNLNLGLWQDSGSNRLPTDGVYFHQRYETESEALRTGATATTELYFTCTAQGNGLAESASSDTPTAGKTINRKIYYSEAGFADPDTGTWVEFTPAPADDASFATVKAALLEYLKARTGGTVPISLKQTWEETEPSTYLLDQAYGSGAEAAYSTRQLRLAQTDCMTIRRASDSTTTTIGFDGSGNIDEAAITTFCTGTTCTVSEWKDQSGNGNNATQATASAQPTIYTGGAIVKENGKLALDFGGTSELNFTTIAKVDVNPFAVFAIAQDTVGNLLFVDSTDNQNDALLVFTSYGQLRSMWNGSMYLDFINSDGLYRLFSVIDDGTNPVNTFYSGELVTDSSFQVTNKAINLNRIGGVGYNALQKYAGIMQEAIFYASDKSTDRTSIEENIGDYFTQNTPLLDTYSGAAAAYSLRLLDSTYTGSAIRVRRSSDNTEQDINFNVFDELDTVSLTAFAGTGDAFVKTWYDQSGNSNDATQTTTSNQPKIVSSGAVIVDANGKPRISVEGTKSMTIGNLNLTEVHGFVLFEKTALGAYGALGTSQITGHWGYTSGKIYDGFYNNSRPLIAGNGTISANTPALMSMSHNGTMVYRVNATEVYNQAGTFTNATSIQLKGYYDFKGYYQEIVLYPSVKSAPDTTGIETNINTFYNIY